jgi:hypothetical protein
MKNNKNIKFILHIINLNLPSLRREEEKKGEEREKQNTKKGETNLAL